MAMVVLTSQQKEELKNYQDFREEVKWGILNKSNYWQGLDGSSVPGNDHVRWAKSRSYAAQINYSPSQIDLNQNSQIVDRFLIYAKNIACVDDTLNPFNPAQVVTFLLANSHFDAMSDNWFDDQIEVIPF